LAALANGLLPMRRVAQLEAERRHTLEMELRQSGFLREGGSPARSAGFDLDRAPGAPPAASGDANTRYPRRVALAAD
jgi:hypothetical protein